MQIQLPASWQAILKSEIEKAYFQDLKHFVEQEYRKNTCYPEEKNIFSALELCPFDQVKVVLLGQDPYHGEGQAHGLSFSVQEGVKLPPSLKNIFKELQEDLGKPTPAHGNLTHWSKQGVLLLNATLTVREKQAGSHQKKGWEIFTDKIIEKIAEEKQGVVFLLWGGFAKKKAPKIDTKKHFVLSSGHPSPLSANRGYWFGNKHFSQTNAYLEKSGKSPIDW